MHPYFSGMLRIVLFIHYLLYVFYLEVERIKPVAAPRLYNQQSAWKLKADIWMADRQKSLLF